MSDQYPPQDPNQPGATPPPGSMPPPAQPYGTPGPYPQQMSDSDQRMWAILAHILGIPTMWLAPLVIYLIHKDRGEYVATQAREALNFQLTLFIAYVIGIITILIVIGFVIVAAVGICSLVFGVIAAVAASKGEQYRYPLAIRMVS